MDKKLFLILAMVLLVASSREIRSLQGWDDPNCSQWSDDGLTCKKCSWRTYRNTEQNKCTAVDDSCKTWSQTNGDCIKCFDSYGDAFYNGSAINGQCKYYNGNEPQPTPPFQYDVNCQCYSDQKVCLECYETFYLDLQGKCQAAPAGCKTFQNGTCVQCIQGYTLNSQGECLVLPADCIDIDQNGACAECAQGFFLTQDGNCVQSPENCADIGSDGLCRECNQGYYLDEQSDCNLLPDNCNATNTQGLCTECQEGYFLDSQNQCEFLPQNCFITDQNGICTQCTDGYYLDSDKQCSILSENCLAANAKGECTQCADGFNVVGGDCVIQIGAGQPNPDCAEQDESKKCIKCRPFYKLKKGMCTPTGENPFCKAGACQCGSGKCLQCKQGYFLDNHGVCTVISQNCQEYSKLSGKCTSCIQNYEIVDGQCVPVSQNPIINMDCKEQTESGTCTSCRKYYKMKDGECVPTGDNPKCHSWDSQGECQCCYYHDRYYLDNNNICVRKNANCLQFNPLNGQCTLCTEKYILQDGQCMQKSENTQNSDNEKQKDVEKK